MWIHSRPGRAVLTVLLLVLTVLFFFGGPDYHSWRVYKLTWSLGHILYFALLALLLAHWPGVRSESFGRQALLVLAVTLVLGSAVELIQGRIGRVMDAGDLGRDFIGALVGLFFLTPGRESLGPGRLRAVQAAVILLVGIQIYPVGVALTDEVLMRRQFPLLSGFEMPLEVQRWEGSAEFRRDDRVVLEGRYALRVGLRPQKYSGVYLNHFKGDWRGARSVRFSVYNPSNQPVALTCQIHDRAHSRRGSGYYDRYNRIFNFVKGWRTVEIPIEEIASAPRERRMDMGQVIMFALFATDLPYPREIYVDEVMLVM